MLLLLSSFSFAEELNLICEGVVDQEELTSSFGTTTSNTQNGALTTNIYGTETIQFKASFFLYLDMDKETGVLELPETMRRPGAKVLKTDLTELKVTGKKISGKAKFNAFARHKFNIDRRTGNINYKFADSKFNGSCRKNDIVENKF